MKILAWFESETGRQRLNSRFLSEFCQKTSSIHKFRIKKQCTTYRYASSVWCCKPGRGIRMEMDVTVRDSQTCVVCVLPGFMRRVASITCKSWKYLNTCDFETEIPQIYYLHSSSVSQIGSFTVMYVRKSFRYLRLTLFLLEKFQRVNVLQTYDILLIIYYYY